MVMPSENGHMVLAPPGGRALWIRHDGKSTIHVNASTCFIPAGLSLSVEECFEARVMHVDRLNKCLFVRPASVEGKFEQLSEELRNVVISSPKIPPAAVNLKSVYTAVTEGGIFRMVLLKRNVDNDRYTMYAVDIGKQFSIDGTELSELAPSLRGVPPLCVCIVLKGCAFTDDCDEFCFLEEEKTCICKLSGDFPSSYPRGVKEMYPPAIMARVFEKDEYGDLIELKCPFEEAVTASSSTAAVGRRNRSCNSNKDRSDCRSRGSEESFLKRPAQSRHRGRGRGHRLAMKSASAPTVTHFSTSCHTFPKFFVHLPHRMNARVTEKIDFDTYLMRDTALLTNLYTQIVRPDETSAVSVGITEGLCCLVRLVRPTKAKRRLRARLFRAIVRQYDETSKMFSVLLVDYGQTVECEANSIFGLKEQPSTVLETPAASFTCHVKRTVQKKNHGSKAFRACSPRTVRLTEEAEYSICLIKRCGPEAYSAIVTLPDSEFVEVAPRSSDYVENRHEEGVEDSKEPDNDEEAERSRCREVKRRAIIREVEALHEEAEKFYRESDRREHELKMLSVQMQLLNLSAKLDVVSNIIKSCPTARHIFYANAVNNQQSYPTVSAHSLGGDQPYPNYNQFAAVPGIFTRSANEPLSSSATYQPSSAVHADSVSVQSEEVKLFNEEAQITHSCTLSTGTPVSPVAEQSDNSIIASCCSTRKIWQIHECEATAENNLRLADGVISEETPLKKEESMVVAGARQQAPVPVRNINDSPLISNSTFRNVSPTKRRTAFLGGFDQPSDLRRKPEYGEPPRFPISEYISERKTFPAEQSTCLSTKGHPSVSLFGDAQHTWNPLDVMTLPCCKSVEESREIHLQANSVVKERKLKRSDEVEKVLHTAKGFLEESFRSSGPILPLDESRVGEANRQSKVLQSVGGDVELPVLHYKHFVDYLDVEEGSEYTVKRSDWDNTFVHWPLFFVQLQEGCIVDAFYRDFDMLHTFCRLPSEETFIGKLCIVQYSTSGSRFRAVVVGLDGNRVKVHLIDYGNYETVSRDQIFSVNGMPTITRHKALAIPCILLSTDGLSCTDSKEAQTLEKAKLKTPSPGEKFRIQVVRKRADGVVVVRVTTESPLLVSESLL